MNKQELIDKLASLVGSIEDFKGISTFHDGKYAGLEHALELIKQLDEPQKPVMPKFFDDWAKQVLEKRDKFYAISLITRAGWGYGVDYELDNGRSPSGTKELLNWIVENEGDDYPNKKKATEALLYGYEVEKEPKYYLILPHITKMTHGHATKIHNISTGVTKDLAYDIFSEEEIKEIDERYWPFAVPVEEVTER